MHKVILAVSLCCALHSFGQEKAKETAMDNWDRMLQCSEQMDRLAKREGWGESRAGDQLGILSWQNHYSPKHRKCFVQIFYLYDRSKLSPSAISENRVPSLYWQLLDAYENRVLASATSDFPSSPWCLIHGKSQPCSICESFIEDRMAN
jgi:hypothetical protein